jgi:hypothetical protein
LCKKQTFCYYDATHFLVCLPPCSFSCFVVCYNPHSSAQNDAFLLFFDTAHIIADRYSTDDALSLGRQFKYIPGIEDGMNLFNK